MQARWMKRRNENGEKEKFYPITHADAVVDLTTVIQENVMSSTSEAFENIQSDIQRLTDEKASKDELPTKVSELTNDSGYLTSNTTPVKSVNGKTGAVNLTASDVGADVSGAASTVQSNLNALNDEFDDHVADATAHMTNTQKTQLSTAYSHSQATHARTDATKVAKSNTNGNILINGTETVVYTHPTGTNPHGITKADIGLGNVNNTSDANKPVSTAQKAAIDAVQTNVNTVDDKVDDHIADADIHFTTAERTKLSGIATGANKYTHPTSGVTAGTYKSVTVDANGHVTKGTNPTTLSGYGITDAESKGTATSTVNTHNVSTSAHNDIRLLVSDISTKLNNFLNVDDTTKDQLSEIIALIDANADDIESITSGKVNVSDIVNNLTTNVSNKPLSAAQGVAIKALIDSLQGNLETHVSNADVHFTTVERTKLSGITTGAEVNQNAFSNVKVGSTTITADAKTDTIEFVGSNVTITPDATNDKVTFAVADGSTSAKGVVQLTNSISSTSTTTAATPNSVKSAYDLANSANTKATNAQTTADGKSDKGHKHIVSEITDLTATATELNYMDGVTSNVQTQLDGKSNSDHTHTAEDVGALPIEGGTISGTTIEINNGTAMLYGDANNIVLGTDVDANNKRQLALYNENRQSIKGSLYLKDIKNGETSNYLLYGEHNKPTANDVGAVQREIFWYNPASHSDKLVTFIWSLIDQGYTSGVIQVDGAYTAPTDVPTSVTDKLGTYYICVFQKHGYGFVEAELHGDGTTLSYRNRSQIGENAWKHDWVESFNYNGFLPLTGGTINGNLGIKSSILSNTENEGQLAIQRNNNSYVVLDTGNFFGYALPNTNANHYGVMCLKQGSGSEGGELHLEASADTPTQSGIILDQCNSSFRIFGIPSADGTTRTGTGTPLVIDPYNKNIIGGYTFDGAATTLSQTLPITKGGTGSTSRGEANQNLTCIGANPITSTSNDTTTNWNAIGTGHCYYAVNGCLIGQPSQYGVLVNFTYGSEVFQLFNQQAYGGLNYRSGNYYGWDGQTQTTNSWKKIYDTGNIQKGNWAITSGSNLANDYIYLQYE